MACAKIRRIPCPYLSAPPHTSPKPLRLPRLRPTIRCTASAPRSGNTTQTRIAAAPSAKHRRSRRTVSLSLAAHSATTSIRTPESGLQAEQGPAHNTDTPPTDTCPDTPFVTGRESRQRSVAASLYANCAHKTAATSPLYDLKETPCSRTDCGSFP